MNDLEDRSYYYFSEDKPKRITYDENKNHNLLIEADNYLALKHLIKINQKVDVIYIDPPYNTGKEFVYNDKKINKEDSFKHSAWLSFMKKRLKLAKQVLSDDGVIFVSIDDNEQAYLKVLMDEIFSEDNFAGEFIRKTKSTTNDAKTGFNMQHEKLFLYCKDKDNIILQGAEKDFKNYKNPDNDPNGDWISDNPTTQGKGYYYKIINPITKKEIYPPHNREWCFSKKSFDEMLKNKKIKWTDENRGFIYKRYKKDLRTKYQMANSLEFIDNKYMNQSATKNMNLIFSDKNKDEIFNYPKGVCFLKKIISFINNKNLIILDFFAGSSTTAHAVMELNKEDGGNRRFIMVTNNENNIANNCSYERLHRIIKGKTTRGETNFKWLESNEPFKENLKYLKLNITDKKEGNFEDLLKNKKLYEHEFNLKGFNILNIANE